MITLKERYGLNNYFKKNERLRNNFEEVDFSSFCYGIFGKAIENNLMAGDNDFDKKGNGIINYYHPNFSKASYFRKLKKDGVVKFKECKKNSILTKDSICERDFSGMKNTYMSTQLYYGKETKNLTWFLTFDIDFDAIRSDEDLKKLLSLINEGKILCPTFISNSGNGLHLFYVLDTPLYVFNSKEKYAVLRAIKKAICIRLAKTFGCLYPIAPLGLEHKTRTIGSAIKFAETHSKSREEASQFPCTAFRTGEYVSILEILKFIGREMSEPKNVASKYTKEISTFSDRDDFLNYILSYNDQINKRMGGKIVERKTFKSNGKEYYGMNKNLYNGWFNRCLNEVEEGHRYFSLIGLASYAVKCKVPYDTLFQDAKKLQTHFNEIGEPFTDEDLEKALLTYKKTEARYYKGSYIAENSGLKVKDKSERNKGKRTRKEHVEWLRSLGVTGRKSVYKDFSKKIKEAYKEDANVIKKSMRELTVLTDYSVATVHKYYYKVKGEIIAKGKVMSMPNFLQSLSRRELEGLMWALENAGNVIERGINDPPNANYFFKN